MKTIKTLPHSDAGKYIREKYACEIEQDVCARIPLLIAVPSTATLGDIMETLFWCKDWEQGDEVVGLPTTLRHWSFNVSIKAEYLTQFLTMLYGCTYGMVYEETE